jgi:23S rRNA (pseudouridine1915-N3)-methyltransferase
MAKIELWLIGKTERGWTEDGESVYANRLGRYISFEKIVFPEIKERLEPDILKKKEGENVLKKLLETDFLVLLDERGRDFSSVDFANWLQNRLDLSPKRIVFLVGGAFGFSPEMYARADFKMSISKMTFPHQLIRVLFLEQLYRAFSILKNEPYHNI